MIHRPNNVDQLERTISALEQMILTTSDREIISGGTSEASHVTAIIAKSMARCDTSTDNGVLDLRSRSKPKRQPSLAVNDWQSRIAFLRDLMATRPELSPRLGAVFGTGRTPTSEELNKLTDELIQLGLIAKNGLKKK